MIDKIIIEADKILKILTTSAISTRKHPDADITNEEPLSSSEQKHAASLMRVNHCGEVCAQGLYKGQALTAKNKVNQEGFEIAANEETEHLAWTAARIHDLGGRTSLFNPIFYMASLGIGVLAGSLGDKWSLGFLEETERQVERHLSEHLQQLPITDKKSLAVVYQMKLDEEKHAQMAHDSGAAQLPVLIKQLMSVSSGIMTKITYYV